MVVIHSRLGLVISVSRKNREKNIIYKIIFYNIETEIIFYNIEIKSLKKTTTYSSSKMNLSFIETKKS